MSPNKTPSGWMGRFLDTRARPALPGELAAREQQLHLQACARAAALAEYRQRYRDAPFIPFEAMTWDQIDHWTLLRYRLRDYRCAADAEPFRRDEFEIARQRYGEIATVVFTSPHLMPRA